MSVRSVRGAIQVRENSSSAIIDGVLRLVGEVLSRNGLDEDDLIHVVFSQTRDLTAKNPATALRESAYGGVPLFCTQEPDYEGSHPRMLRVLVMFNSSDDQKPIPVYLDGAEKLRPDLS